MSRTQALLALALSTAVACGPEADGLDTEPTDAAGTDTEDSDTQDSDTDASDTETSGEAPEVSLVEAFIGGPIDSEVVFEVVVEDEAPDTVVLTLELEDALLDGAFDGLVFTGTVQAAGSATGVLTATDADGNTARIDVRIEGWVPRTWSGAVPLGTEEYDLPGADIGVSAEGWTYVAGYARADGMLFAADPDTLAWGNLFTDDTEYGRGVAWDEGSELAIYIAEAYPASQGLVRGVDATGIVWEVDAPWENTTTYWIDCRDGACVQSGTFSGHDDEAGAWASVLDPRDGAAIGDPIVLGADDADRIVPMSTTLMEDGRVLASVWGYHDLESGDSHAYQMSWVQIARAGDEEPTPLVTYRLEDADVEVTHALELHDGNILALGSTGGDLFGTLDGETDGFLELLTPEGDSVWNLQVEVGRFLRTAQGHDGTVYVVGDAGPRGASCG